MGQNGELIEVVYKISNWILRLVFVNFLWILFSFLGLLIVGFFPSTIAMFSVVRRWVLGESNVAIFDTFWNTFKKQLLKSNILGYSLSFIGVVLYADLIYLQHAEHYFLQLLYFPVLFITFLYILSLLYVIPIFVHYDLRGIHIIKNAFFISIFTPLATIKLCLGLLVIVYLMVAFSGSIILFSGSITSYFIMLVTNSAFQNNEKKRAQIMNGI
jgi:uncharacterized membrane protein YesL